MRIKTFFWGLAAVGTMVTAPAWAELKIAVIDYGRLVQESPQAKSATEAIKAEFTPRQRELQKQRTTLKEREDRLQKDGETMTPDQRATAEQQLRDGARDLQRKESEIQEDFNARRNEEMSRLQKIVIEQVRTYAKAQNFDLVLADGVLYSTPALDVTPAILSALQQHAGAASGARPSGTAPAPASKPPGQ